MPQIPPSVGNFALRFCSVLACLHHIIAVDVSAHSGCESPPESPPHAKEALVDSELLTVEATEEH